MTATVYHADYDRKNRDLAFEIGFDPKPDYVKAHVLGGDLRYLRVATLPEVNDREKAYHLTNTSDHDWWTNLGIERHFKGKGCRSTSVGDIIDENGTFYLVVGVGMIPINFNARQHVEVDEALNNRHENGYPMDGNYEVAEDLVTNCALLEEEDPSELIDHIQAWRHRRLGRDLNNMIKDAVK